MRREYDFSQGTRGKHVGKHIRIVEKHSHDRSNVAAGTEQVSARDLKRPEAANDVSVKRKHYPPELLTH